MVSYKALNTILKILPSLLLVIAICLLFNRYYIQVGWIGFVIKTIVCTLVYILSVWNFAMDNSEKELLSVPIKKILKIK